MSHLAVCSSMPALLAQSVDMTLIPSEGAILLSLPLLTSDPEIIGLAVVVAVLDSDTTGVPKEEEGRGQDSMARPVNL